MSVYKIGDHELKPEMVPKISDDKAKISRFSKTMGSFDKRSFLLKKRELLREGEFENIKDARRALYLIFWSLHWAMESLEEDKKMYVQAEKALEYIRNYAIENNK
jgi:hypothetical protein